MSKTYEELAALGRIVHEPARLAILTALSACDSADFTFLRRVIGLTGGNLNTHLTTLETAGFVLLQKRFEGKVSHTAVLDTVRPARHRQPLGATGCAAARGALPSLANAFTSFAGRVRLLTQRQALAALARVHPAARLQPLAEGIRAEVAASASRAPARISLSRRRPWSSRSSSGAIGFIRYDTSRRKRPREPGFVYTPAAAPRHRFQLARRKGHSVRPTSATSPHDCRCG